MLLVRSSLMIAQVVWFMPNNLGKASTNTFQFPGLTISGPSEHLGSSTVDTNAASVELPSGFLSGLLIPEAEPYSSSKLGISKSHSEPDTLHAAYGPRQSDFQSPDNTHHSSTIAARRRSKSASSLGGISSPHSQSPKPSLPSMREVEETGCEVKQPSARQTMAPTVVNSETNQLRDTFKSLLSASEVTRTKSMLEKSDQSRLLDLERFASKAGTDVHPEILESSAGYPNRKSSRKAHNLFDHAPELGVIRPSESIYRESDLGPKAAQTLLASHEKASAHTSKLGQGQAEADCVSPESTPKAGSTSVSNDEEHVGQKIIPTKSNDQALQLSTVKFPNPQYSANVKESDSSPEKETVLKHQLGANEHEPNPRIDSTDSPQPIRQVDFDVNLLKDSKAESIPSSYLDRFLHEANPPTGERLEHQKPGIGIPSLLPVDIPSHLPAHIPSPLPVDIPSHPPVDIPSHVPEQLAENMQGNSENRAINSPKSLQSGQPHDQSPSLSTGLLQLASDHSLKLNQLELDPLSTNSESDHQLDFHPMRPSAMSLDGSDSNNEAKEKSTPQKLPVPHLDSPKHELSSPFDAKDFEESLENQVSDSPSVQPSGNPQVDEDVASPTWSDKTHKIVKSKTKDVFEPHSLPTDSESDYESDFHSASPRSAMSLDGFDSTDEAEEKAPPQKLPFPILDWLQHELPSIHYAKDFEKSLENPEHKVNSHPLIGSTPAVEQPFSMIENPNDHTTTADSTSLRGTNSDTNPGSQRYLRSTIRKVLGYTSKLFKSIKKYFSDLTRKFSSKKTPMPQVDLQHEFHSPPDSPKFQALGSPTVEADVPPRTWSEIIHEIENSKARSQDAREVLRRTEVARETPTPFGLPKRTFGFESLMRGALPDEEVQQTKHEEVPIPPEPSIPIERGSTKPQSRRKKDRLIIRTLMTIISFYRRARIALSKIL